MKGQLTAVCRNGTELDLSFVTMFIGTFNLSFAGRDVSIVVIRGIHHLPAESNVLDSS